MNHWQVLQTLEKRAKAEEVIKLLLANRQLKKKKEIEEFFSPAQPVNLTAPGLGISQREMKRAIRRIKKAIDEQEPIVVYGDYDADGVCATAILWETLHQLGAQVMPFIPLRKEEGYGLSLAGLKRMKKELGPVKLIITVDNGITADKAIQAAKKQKIDVIVTDHHLPGQKKPAALAIIHTTQLAGAGVAWFFSKEISGQEDGHLALAAIGTIADIMPLLGPNRSLVKYGLQSLRRTRRLGLLSLFQATALDKNKLEPWQVSFILAPRLNATGRLTDAMDSLRLLCTRDSARARGLAQKLNAENNRRQRLTEKASWHVQETLREPLSKLLFAASADYHEGVIGLVAGDLVKRFHRPAVVFSLSEKKAKGSARSVEGFNILQAIRGCEKLLVNYGGHPMAAGLTVEREKLAALKKQLTRVVEATIKEEDLRPVLKIDCQLKLFHLTWKLYEQLEKLAPFGMANPRPVFCSRGLRVTRMKVVGNHGRHLKIQLDDPQTPQVEDVLAFEEAPAFEGIGFGLGDLAGKIKQGDLVDVAYTLEKNSWQDEEKLELKIKDLRVAV